MLAHAGDLKNGLDHERAGGGALLQAGDLTVSGGGTRPTAIAAWPRWLVEGKPRPKSGRFTFTTWRFYTKDSPLLESGLLGPVAVWSAKTVAIR